MKKISKYLLALTIMVLSSAISIQAQNNNQLVCRLGLVYQISYQSSWGGNSAVIITVKPASAASRAGLRSGDIITTIDGQKVADMEEEDINSYLLRTDHRTVTFTVTNFGYKDKRVVMTKDIRPALSIDEAELSEAFNMYSLEDVTSRRYALPFVYTAPSSLDLTNYKSFSIVAMNAQDKNMKGLYDAIITTLRGKGLVYKQSGGELLIHTEGSLIKNPHYRASDVKPIEQHNYRYDSSTHDVRDYPLCAMSSPDFEGQYELILGIKILDSKSNQTVWTAKGTERTTTAYAIGAYAQSFVPQVLMNFPFIRYPKYPVYVYHHEQYLYTGLNYNSNNMKQIYYVDPDSPAANAGLQAGEELSSINGIETNSSTDKLTKEYKRFIMTSYKYRNPETIYTDDEGYQRCMYWNASDYDKIAKMMQNSSFISVFSYLFCNRPYVINPPAKEIIFDVKRGRRSTPILVQPKFVKRDYIELR